ncbi:MAG: hypothetical protein D6690_01635 [Nitrospirae bacterium]|nr:MAG: hypothetical protein D6690_01635 [Nitrospirota bacterium]
MFTRRSDAFQNLSGVNLRYLWSARFSTTLGYRNRLTLFTSDAFQDTMVHTVNVGTAYALAPTTDVRMTYGVSISDFIGGQAQNTGIQGGGSFTTHSGTIGLSHRFSPTLASSAQVGMAVTNSRMNFIANASLAKQFQRTTLSVGYRQNVTSGGGLAASATLTQSFVGTLNHMLTNRLAAFAQGGVSRSESLSGSVIDVMAYQARTGVSYLILSWLSGSASYSYIFQDSSGTAGNDAQVNQVFVTLTAFAPPWRILE